MGTTHATQHDEKADNELQNLEGAYFGPLPNFRLHYHDAGASLPAVDTSFEEKRLIKVKQVKPPRQDCLSAL